MSVTPPLVVGTVCVRAFALRATVVGVEVLCTGAFRAVVPVVAVDATVVDGVAVSTRPARGCEPLLHAARSTARPPASPQPIREGPILRVTAVIMTHGGSACERGRLRVMKSWVIRLGVGYFALTNLLFGVWASVAPKNYFESFPGGGRTWVALDGPYNEHLMRDYGALNLGLAAVAICALIFASRPLVIAIAIAEIVYTLPHVVYHLSHSSRLGDTSDQFGAIGGLLFNIVVGVVVLLYAIREPALERVAT
jgi:hypothetical protein